jgi:hypothetical protein
MRIDSASQQQLLNLSALTQREGAGEVENDGDADDGAQAPALQARAQPASQLYAQGVGSKIDLLA